MLGNLQNQVAIVTGGSRGIGRGIARVLAKAGANVLVAGLEENECREAAEELRSFGVEAEGIAGDVTKRDFCEKMVRLAVERWGRLDVLCANAGIFPQAKLEEMTEADFERVMNVNVKGTFLSVQAAIPVMKKQGYGRIVLTSSITGPITGYPGWAHYGASKAAQLGLMRTAAIELAPYGITVNAVQPGNIATEGLDGLGDEYLAQMARCIPMKRLGTPEDIGTAVLFFASKEAHYVTGQSLVVDGGQILPESPEELA